MPLATLSWPELAAAVAVAVAVRSLAYSRPLPHSQLAGWLAPGKDLLSMGWHGTCPGVQRVDEASHLAASWQGSGSA
jgi:hypothetical protein